MPSKMLQTMNIITNKWNAQNNTAKYTQKFGTIFSAHITALIYLFRHLKGNLL